MFWAICAALLVLSGIGSIVMPDASASGQHGYSWFGTVIFFVMAAMSGVVALSYHHTNKVYDRRRRD